MLGGVIYRRLRQALLPDLRRLWTRDIERSSGPLSTTLAELQAEVDGLRRGYRDLLVSELNRRHADLLDQLPRVLRTDSIRAHFREAVARAEVATRPTAHLVLDEALPPAFYDLLLRALPPAETFPTRDPVKQDFEMDALDGAPVLSQRVWRFFDGEVVAGVLVPVLIARFSDAIRRRYAEMGGEDFGARAAAIPHRGFAGRIQLRRPGYHLRPHMDPKRATLTGLLYLARPGDSERFGTELYELDRPIVAPGLKTFFPEDAGATCSLARSVPFRPNSMLVFLNAAAAHGATLPAEADLRERYAYQFYVKPDDGALKRLLAGAPEAVRASWTGLV